MSIEHWSPVLRRWVHARLFPSAENPSSCRPSPTPGSARPARDFVASSATGPTPNVSHGICPTCVDYCWGARLRAPRR